MANLQGLPNAAAVCSYNGVAFLTGYKSHIASRPVLDEAERTTVYVEHTLTVEGYVAAITTDATLTTMRKSLTACGGQLNYNNKGFGALVVNVGSVRDVKWGPIPEILEWVPLGGDCNAARVTWRCVTRIPECDAARYQYDLLAFNYEVAFDIDEAGYTTFRVGGYMEIPMTRISQNNRQLPDSIDRYRGRLLVPVVPGFQRKSQSYRDSKDKRRCDFQFVDEEVPSPLPDGATHIDARETIEASLEKLGKNIPGAFRGWLINIEATITMARGLSKSKALDVFTAILRSRLAKFDKTTILDIKIRYEDDIFGRTAGFSYTGAAIAGQTINSILVASDIWRPIDGTSFARWQGSLGPPSNATGVRGWAGLRNNPEDDVIVDLCAPTSSPIFKKPPVGVSVEPKKDDGKPLEAGPKIRNLTKDSSWVTYRPGIRQRTRTNVVRHKPLPKPPLNAPPIGNGGGLPPLPISGGVVGGLQATGKYSGPPATDAGPALAQGALDTGDTTTGYPADVFQRTAAPTRTIVFSGFATRIGYRIPVPKLVSVGGVPAVELERDVIETEPTAVGAVLIFGLVWSITYAIGQAPAGSLPYLANPEFGTVGGTGANSPLPR